MLTGDVCPHAPQATQAILARHHQRGMGYLLVLFALAALGLLLAGAGQVWATHTQREKEAELLFIGQQFSQALRSYHTQSPGGVRHYPARFEDLVEDRRFAVPRRHLRRIYPDPMTGQADWALVRTGEQIVAIHSQSPGLALKTAFDSRDAALAGTTRYQEWVFGPGETTLATDAAALELRATETRPVMPSP